MGMPCIIKWQDYLGVAHCAVMWAFLNASPVIRFHKVTKYKQIFKLKDESPPICVSVWCVGRSLCRDGSVCVWGGVAFLLFYLNFPQVLFIHIGCFH